MSPIRRDGHRPIRGPVRRRVRRQDGLGLVEVLVALVVVSFGVLGMAGLQLTGMKHSSGGFNRSKALLFAENMATRMRINPPGATALAWESFDSEPLGSARCDVKPAPYCQASAGVAAERCDVAELAAFDVWTVACGDWGTDAAGGGVLDALPEGRLEIGCGTPTCPDDATYTITVEWNEGSARTGAPVAAGPAGADAEEPGEIRRVRMRLRP